MARHKKHQLVPEPDPALDISSLIDVCFLLLIYFIVTSTIKPRETDLGLGLPGSNTRDDQPELAPMLISIQSSGAIYTGDSVSQQVMDTDSGSRDLPLLTSQLELYKNAADAAGEKPLVQLNASPDATTQRVVDVLNALAGKGIDSITFTNLLDD